MPFDGTEIGTAELLLAAADLIEREGWTQGTYRDDSGFCLIGALCAVCGRPADGDTLAMVGARFLPVLDFDEMAKAWDWNDYRNRTQRQVTKRLRAAAASPAP